MLHGLNHILPFLQWSFLTRLLLVYFSLFVCLLLNWVRYDQAIAVSRAASCPSGKRETQNYVLPLLPTLTKEPFLTKEFISWVIQSKGSVVLTVLFNMISSVVSRKAFIYHNPPKKHRFNISKKNEISIGYNPSMYFYAFLQYKDEKKIGKHFNLSYSPS